MDLSLSFTNLFCTEFDSGTGDRLCWALLFSSVASKYIEAGSSFPGLIGLQPTATRVLVYLTTAQALHHMKTPELQLTIVRHLPMEAVLSGCFRFCSLDSQDWDLSSWYGHQVESDALMIPCFFLKAFHFYNFEKPTFVPWSIMWVKNLNNCQ